MYVLVGQVLNARGRFGPMMWAPIANNLIAIAMLGVYLARVGPIGDGRRAGTSALQQRPGGAPRPRLDAGHRRAVPGAAALPPRAGFRYRPRFDFRGTGLGHTAPSGVWTVLFVVANQAAYFVVVTSSPRAAPPSPADGTGLTVYCSSLLIMMVPHSIVTVSLATAILPRLSAYATEDRLAELGSTVGSTLRTALVVVLPFAVLVPIVAGDMAGGLRLGAASHGGEFAPTLAVFGPALVFFTVHYMMLRGFYAMEQTRLVFFIQSPSRPPTSWPRCVLVPVAPPRCRPPRSGLAWMASYVVGRGASASSSCAARWAGSGRRSLVRFLMRMVVACCRRGAGGLVVEQALAGLGERPAPLLALVRGGTSALAGGLVAARRGAADARPRGHDPGRQRRGAAAARMRLPRVDATDHRPGAGRVGSEVSDADVDAGR